MVSESLVVLGFSVEENKKTMKFVQSESAGGVARQFYASNRACP